MQFCPKCGAAWRRDAQFCTRCGYRLGTDVTAPGAGFLNAADAIAKQKQKPRMSGGARAWRVLVSILLCMFLFPSLMGGMALASVRIAGSRLAVSAAVQMVDVEKAYLDYSDTTIADEVYRLLDTDAVSAYGITRDDVTAFLDNGTLRAFAGDLAGDFASDFFTDNGKGVLTADDVVDFIFDNEEMIYDELGYSVDESDRALLYDGAVDALGGDAFVLTEALEDDEGGVLALRVLRGLFSVWTITAFFGVALACAVGAYFLWRGYFFAFSRTVGTPLVLAGILYLFAAVGILLVPGLLHSQEGISANLLNAMLLPGGVGIGLMALLAILVAAFLMAVGTRKRKRARAANGI